MIEQTLLILAASIAMSTNVNTDYTNTLGMRMVYIRPGTFKMGAETAEFSMGPRTDESKDAPFWDETPVHKVTITRGFLMAQEEVTVEQFRRFRPDYEPTPFHAPYATGVSWLEAQRFCKWLSEKEGKPYRLPTEAEWEYACRAGTQTLFWSGNRLPKEDLNPWGLRNMHSGPAEWCFDWHGEYPESDQKDPIGCDGGWGRVVRGGAVRSVEWRDPNGKQNVRPDTSAVWYRCANRCSLMPETSGYDENNVCHYVGFRVVQADMPASEPLPRRLGFPLEGVRQAPVDIASGPDPNRPYFKARVIIPSPPDFTQDTQCAIVGFDRAMQGKVHSGGITYCPNGDLLAISFSSRPGKSEAAPNTIMVVTRLRRGADEWDMPAVFYDLSGLNDQSGLLWNDGGKIWFFGGGRDLGEVPFRFTTSQDSGATWTDLKVPMFKEHRGPFTAQPINSVFRGPDGTIYLGCDGKGGTSLLYASSDEGRTWRDTGGRTAGRHTTFVLLKSGRILGMGGKNTNIERYMPKCYSSDFGKTWSASEKTPFSALSSNQRPKVMRLASGRLFMAGDFQTLKINHEPPPEAVKERGAYVALSDDEGETWKIKPLRLAPPHNQWKGVPQTTGKPQHGYGTLGYCDAVQAPDGLIHLMTSKGKPSMHFAMNESWILSDEKGEAGLAEVDPNNVRLVTFQERYAGGKLKASWSGYTDSNGMFILHGRETWYYPDGKKQYEVTRHGGKKIGVERYWNPDGSKEWERRYSASGSMVWTTWWPNGRKRSESQWVGYWAGGKAIYWSASGNIVATMVFREGRSLSTPIPDVNDD